jgi:thioredoxin reductase (NADPH)
MVVGSMVGSGIFSLPRTFGIATGPFGAIIAWCIAAGAMYTLARVFQALAERKPDLDAGGDSALEEATFLTKFATTVHLIHRREEFRGSKIMQDRALKNPKIRVHWNSVVERILESEGAVRGIELADTKTGAKSELPLTGLFIAIGHVPNTTLVRGQVDLDANGYVQLDGHGTMTNIEGVFACGDVADHVYRQAVTAAGTGCQAAIDAERWLESRAHAG